MQIQQRQHRGDFRILPWPRQTYSVVASYATKSLVRQSRHLINIDIEQPSRGLAVELDYTGCNIA